MDRITQLIRIFLFVSEFVNSYFIKNPEQKNFSPNQNYFHPEEVITAYLFGIEVGLVSVKEIHSYILDHFIQWVPNLPDYNAFNYRLNRLSSLFEELPK